MQLHKIGDCSLYRDVSKNLLMLYITNVFFPLGRLCPNAPWSIGTIVADKKSTQNNQCSDKPLCMPSNAPKETKFTQSIG